MREKELRLALICYGGISLAVYMHGITLEIWTLARASRAFHDGEAEGQGSAAIYHRLLATIEKETGVRLRILVDIVAGASAGGINGVFLAHAIATGQPLEPAHPAVARRRRCRRADRYRRAPASRASRLWATPIAWWAAGRPGGAVERTVEPDARAEIRAKLTTFVRARWFTPPFSGEGFTALLLDAFGLMADAPAGPPLLPRGQPLDLFVTVTDFHGHPQRLKLHSPAEAVETEHRLTLVVPRSRRRAARSRRRARTRLRRARHGELSRRLPALLGRRARSRAGRSASEAWPGRAAFLARALPRHAAIGAAERAVLIDGSVLVNAPFRPAIEALRDRPARREIDRRFVYIDPKPGVPSDVPPTAGGGEAPPLPSFFATIFGALSDIPREQPIRDNLEAIDARSGRIRRMRKIIEAIRPEVEAAIEALFGYTFFLDRPTTGAPRRAGGARRRTPPPAPPASPTPPTATSSCRTSSTRPPPCCAASAAASGRASRRSAPRSGATSMPRG